MRRFSPPQLVIFSFLCVIIIGTAVLSLPAATRTGERAALVDSLFTATSATCVTGLIVKDTGSYFSTFGRWVIFVLFQMGGLGIMTFSTLFAVMLGRKMGFSEKDVIRSTLDKHGIIGLKRLIAYILGITFLAELVGALFLFFRWNATTGWSLAETAQRAAFHSVSAFCNAGFALFQTSFMGYMADPYINAVMMILIFIGGIGFVVIMDVAGLFFRKGAARKFSLQSKLALNVSLGLIILGVVALLFFEKDNIMRGMPWPQRFLSGLFQSITARTAGFNTLPVGELAVPSLLVVVFLMFIGASPGSTGGGIKTCTFGILAASLWSMLKNRKRVTLFDRTVPRQVVRESIIIFFLGLSWIFAFTILVLYFQVKQPGSDASLIKVLFEVVSAFGTVGLSAGITPDLSALNKLLITATMFAGRVGPLTLAVAIAFRERKEAYGYPEEEIMVG